MGKVGQTGDVGLPSEVTACLGAEPRRVTRLGGGHGAEVLLAEAAGGARLVVKRGEPAAALRLEGEMLRYLGSHGALPVPAVHHAADGLVIMDWVEGDGRLDARAQAHAADLLAATHGVAAPAFGFERATVIAGLPQPNPWTARWPDFFRDQRLLHMAALARAAGRLPVKMALRIDRLAERLDDWLDAPSTPALLHGDLWGGNILSKGGRITGVIDPAIYYGDAEIELAFTTLFGTFGDAFFARYAEHRRLRPGFFELRRELYNLYPLLVHLRLFGGAYAAQIDRTLRRLGF